MKKPSVLIVGAGAMGLVAGYHLNLAGAQITFLVRAGRIDVFSPPQHLYCYDDATLKTFTDFRTVDNVAGFGNQHFDFVLITLDGATSRSPEGSAMLHSLGDAIRPTDAKVIMGGVGIGLREYILATTGLPDARLQCGLLGLLSHQVSAQLPVLPPTDPTLLAKAAIAYRHFANRIGFYMESSRSAAAREFAEIYNRCGVSRCSVMNATLYNIVTNSGFPMLAASKLAGWPDVSTLVENRELWHLACSAQKEIAALPRHGWIGKLVGLIMTEGLTAKLQRKLEREMLPLDYQAFNRFHHGGKVWEQDIEVMRNCLAEGERHGAPMTALRQLIARVQSELSATTTA